jgi:broad specificity phosphatase PhoE
MPVVLLVRHGQARFGADDYDALSDQGRRQSQVVGSELARRGLRQPVAAHGSLRRQRDTASLALAAARLDVVPDVDPRFDEYDHLGLLARYPEPGLSRPASSRELQGLLDRALEAWIGDVGGGWTRWAGDRVAALTDLATGLGMGRDAVVFTSGGVIAALCADLLGLQAGGVVALNRVMVNGAITKLVVGSSGTSLLSVNEHAHLDPGDVTYR